MKRFIGFFQLLFLMLLAFVCASPAMATSIIDVSTMTPDVTMVGTLGGAICTGLLGIWGVRKVIKLVNRS